MRWLGSKEPKPVCLPEKSKGLTKLIRITSAIDLTSGRPRERGKGEKVTPKELRELRELLRQRYALDLEIWGLRKVGVYNRRIVEEKMKKADSLLSRIQVFVYSMDSRACFGTEAEYNRFKQVKAQVVEPGKRIWMKNPPWQDEE